VSERNRAVAKLEARRLFSARRALAAWWLLAAESAEAGERRREPEPNEDFNDVRDRRKRLKNENESENEDPIDTQIRRSRRLFFLATRSVGSAVGDPARPPRRALARRRAERGGAFGADAARIRGEIRG
jgi:hypothetical protein